MGACCSNERSLTERKYLLEKQNRQNIKQHDNALKVVFLGPGGSGKSTFWKTLRNFYGAGHSNKNRLDCRACIFAQIVDQMKEALECIEYARKEWPDDMKTEEEKIPVYEGEGPNIRGRCGEGGERQNTPREYRGNSGHDIGDRTIASWNEMKLSDDGRAAADVVNNATNKRVTADIAKAIATLWKEPAIKKVYQARTALQIDTSSAYFWDHVHRIASTDYVPDDNDIYLVCHRTTGVVEQKVRFANHTFHIFDVGGQMSERKKWIHCFKHVKAVIYIVALSSYNEVMYEDESQNSMVDGIKLFKEVCNCEWFINTTMILFLNKTDEFKNEIQRVPINVCEYFDDFKGNETSFDETTMYIRSVFEAQNKNPQKQIFCHLLCAVDTNDVKRVFNTASKLIINQHLMRINGNGLI